MGGTEQAQTWMLSLIVPDTRIPADHPLRTVRQVVDRALAALSPEFDRLYADRGRPRPPPEQLLRALLLQLFYGVRSERLLMEQLEYNLLFRWFVGLNLDEPVSAPSVFSKNRKRFLEGDVVASFFALVVGDARTRGLLSDEHFTVDGTQLKGSAAFKSLVRRRRPPGEEPPADGLAPRNPTVSFRGEKRSNATHRSTTDPDVRLARKSDGQEAKLAYLATTLVDNRYGLPVDAEVTHADEGKGEQPAALLMLAARALNVSPQGAQNLHARKATSAIDGRTTHAPSYRISQARRHRIEEGYGWAKTVGLLAKLRHRTLARVQQVVALPCAGTSWCASRRCCSSGAAGVLPQDPPHHLA